MSEFVDFVHLHNHSHFSLYDGMQKIDVMAERAKELGFRGIALTDHGKVGGFIQHHNECKKTNYEKKEGDKKVEYELPSINPIFGCEIYYMDDVTKKREKVYHQTILAKNRVGYENLLQLSTLSHRQIVKRWTNEFPCLSFNDLKDYGEGLIVTSGCTSSRMSRYAIDDDIESARNLAKESKEVWGDDYYLEVMVTGYDPQLKVLKTLIELGRELDIKVVATNDVHYTYKSQAELQKTKISISRGGPLPPDYDQTSEYYMKSYEDMHKIFKNGAEQFLKNTVEVCEKCEVDLQLGMADLPSFLIPEDDENFKRFKATLWQRDDEEAFLRHLSWKGLKERGLFVSEIHRERLAEELETIRFTGFTKYFLIVWEYCNWARSNNIKVGAGRGSGVGSLVLYCLGVTGLDPIKYGLTMDRFLYAKADYRAKDEAFF